MGQAEHQRGDHDRGARRDDGPQRIEGDVSEEEFLDDRRLDAVHKEDQRRQTPIPHDQVRLGAGVQNCSEVSVVGAVQGEGGEESREAENPGKDRFHLRTEDTRPWDQHQSAEHNNGVDEFESDHHAERGSWVPDGALPGRHSE